MAHKAVDCPRMRLYFGVEGRSFTIEDSYYPIGLSSDEKILLVRDQ